MDGGDRWMAAAEDDELECVFGCVRMCSNVFECVW